MSVDLGTNFHPVEGGLGRLRAETAGDDAIVEEATAGSSDMGGSNGRVSSVGSSGAMMRTHGNAREKLVTARAICIIGQGGEGKSSMIQEVQNVIRASGFFGIAKFEGASPFGSFPVSRLFLRLSYI